MNYNNNTNKMKLSLMAIVCVLAFQSKAQNVLSLTEAKRIALEQNYNTKIGQNNLKIVANNNQLIRAGRKPTFGLSSGLNGNMSNNIVKQFAAPVEQRLWLKPSLTANVSASSNYLLWDGRRIENQLDQNAAAQAQAALALKATKENIAYQVENLYITILQLQERQTILEASIDISKKRHERAKYAFEYGQSTKINLLNAEVDLNRDSLNLIQFKQQVSNFKKNLNLLLNRDYNLDYTLSNDLDGVSQTPNVSSTPLAIENNLGVRQAKEAIHVASYDEKINNSNLKPQVFANASYGINYQNNSQPSFTDYILNDGLRLGLTASWTIGDGGRTHIQNENTKIRIKNLELALDQNIDQVSLSINNTEADYQTAYRLYQLEVKNVATTQENFERSQRLFNNGQINSITFRQAQLNLLNAELNKSSAKYNLSLLNLELKRLSGRLLED